MKILVSIPSQSELMKAYDFFKSAEAMQITRDYVLKIASYSQWVRFDARLGEIWIQWMHRRWSEIPSTLLNEEILKHPWPAVTGVLLDHVECLMEKKQIAKFRLWKSSALHAVRKTGSELFFIGTRQFAGKLMSLDAERSLTLYSRWGYLSRDLMINKPRRLHAEMTLLTPLQRRRILKSLLKERKRITANLYIEQCDGMISRRQAQLDLEMSSLKISGNTRNRFYSK